MASNLAQIKNKVKALLEALMPDTLGEVIVDDFKEHFSAKDIAKYPAAIITGVSVESSDMLTNNDNLRTVKVEALIVAKADDVTGSDIEDLQEAVLNALDSDKTLSLDFVLGTMPSVSGPEPVTIGRTGFVIFSATVEVKTNHSLM